MTRRINEKTSDQDAIEPIAVIGMACRFPGDASDITSFWEMMSQGRSASSQVPESRFNIDAYYHPSNDRRGVINTKNGYFLKEDPAKFDAPFFNLTLKEASGMDPMHRLTMEVAYQSLENAGITISNLVKSNTSVFHGCFTGDYASSANADIYNTAPYQATGNGLTMLSNRLSWFFDLRGPSMTIDTACSSSLYAIHLACQSLRTGESEMSIVSGSNLILYPDMMMSLTAAHFLGPDGISRSFDARASGYARGEAIGAVILKPLSKAIADGDTVRAIIRGTGINQDGRTPGITQPNSEAQADLIRTTFLRAGLDMSSTGYFEAHGTGTAVGDPIEMSAIGATLGTARRPDQAPLYVGSVKTNVGHTEGCAGLAGFIKAVLCLEQGKIPPNAGFESLNPKLKFEDWNMALPLQLIDWPDSGVRRACINSFGYGGSNAAAIIDDAHHYLISRGIIANHSTLDTIAIDEDDDSGFNSSATTPESEDERTPQFKLFAFSSADEAGLTRLSKAYSDHLKARTERCKVSDTTEYRNLRRYYEDMAYTLASRRSMLDYRSFGVAPSLSKLAESLDMGLPKHKKIVRKFNAIWVFTGQGSQYAGMGKELINNTVFRSSLLKSQLFLEQNGCEWDVFAELGKNKTESKIDSPEFSQPLCTVLQIALVELLFHWGAIPAAIVGHSSGEVAAAFAARAISHQDAVKVAFQRGHYSRLVLDRQVNGPGGMAAVGLSAEAVQPYIDQLRPGSLVVACINSPSSVTVSGDLDMIVVLESILKEQDIFVRKLKVSTAYHSHHMKTIAEEYRQFMGTIKPVISQETFPIFSSVTGGLADVSTFTADYWVDNLVSPVRFSEACKALLAHSDVKARRRTPISYGAIVEIGPHEGLKGPLNQILASVDSKLSASTMYTSMLKRGENAEFVAATAAGKLWSQGFPISITKVNGQENDLTSKVLSDLPVYPFNHTKSYWHEPPCSTQKRTRKHPRTDLLGAAVDDQNPLEPRWRNFLSISENPWLEHHKITESILFPGAGMLIMAIEAANQIADESRSVKGFELREMTFERGLLIPSADDAIETSINFHIHSIDGSKVWWQYVVYSLPSNGGWTRHHSGLISIIYKDDQPSKDQILEDAEDWKAQTAKYQFLKEHGTIEVKHETFYNELAAVGMQYGELFTNVMEAFAAPGTLSGHGKIKIPDTKACMPHEFEFPHIIHPATLDSIFHLLFIGFTEGRPLHDAGVPYSMESMYISANLPKTPGEFFKAYSVTTRKGERESAGSLVISDADWSEPKIVITNFAAREVTSGSRNGSLEDHKICSVIQWQEDVDHVQEVEPKSLHSAAIYAPAVQLNLWLEKLCFKEVQLDVLILWSHSELFKSTIEQFSPQGEQRRRFQKLRILGEDDIQLESIKDTCTTLGIDAQIGSLHTENLETVQKKFDLVMAQINSPNSKNTEELTSQVSENGRLVLIGESATVIRQSLDDTPSTLYEYNIADESILVVSRKATRQVAGARALVISNPDESNEAGLLKEAIVTKLQDLGYKVTICFGIPAFVDKEQMIISLMEIEHSWVINWTPEDLSAFQSLIFAAGYMLWLTRGGQMLDQGNVDFAATTGLLRTMRTEVPQIKLAHLDLSLSNNLSKAAETILDVFETTYRHENPDLEFAEKNGRIYIPRVIEDASFDRELQYGTIGQKTILGDLTSLDRPFQLSMAQPGSLDSGFWQPEDLHLQPLGATEVEIVATAYGLNAVDLLAASGDTMFTKIGHEASGIITKTGSGVIGLRVGQQVASLGLYSCSTVFRQQQDLVQVLPSNLDIVPAAGCAYVFTAAYYALHQLARLQPGEKILITSAAGGIGQASIQLAKCIGAEIFITVGSDLKKATLMQRYNIPEDHIYTSNDICSFKAIKRMTSGVGVDVVISFNTGEKLRHTWESLAPGGRYVDLNLSSDSRNLSVRQFDMNAAFFSLNLAQLMKSKPIIVAKAFKEVMELFDTGKFTDPYPLQIFDACDIGKAFKTMQSEDHMGKLVLSLRSSKPVPMMAAKAEPLRLDPTATYVLSGGLGGLGPSLAQTMVDAGARSLAFLSRSGASTRSAQDILQTLRGQGCEAEAFACDVSSKEAVERFVQKARLRGWKIKGLIQCAMVLRDSTFDNMTFEKWSQATQPKIQGTWNLHELLPKDLDFFIMLSSVVGIIGNAAQANYIAGNTYMDALAHHRRSLGLAAVSLDVGVVSDSGHFTDDSAFDHFLDRFPHLAPLQMTTPELNKILLTLLKGKTMDGRAVPAQLITGINDRLKRDVNITSVWGQDRKFDHRLRLSQADQSSTQTSGNIAATIGSAKTLAEASEAVQFSLQQTIAMAMSTEPSEIDVDLPLNAFGVDSLKAVEVRNWVYRELKADVSVFEILAAMPMKKLAIQIARRSKLLDAKIVTQLDGVLDIVEE